MRKSNLGFWAVALLAGAGSGICISSAHGAFSPSDLSGLKMWVRADAGVLDGSGTAVTTSGTAVGTWQDQTDGSNNTATDNATQTTAGLRPTWITNAINGKPTLRFDGSSQYLTFNTNVPIVSGQMTIIAVAKPTASNSTAIVGLRGSTTPLIQLDDSNGSSRFIARDTTPTTASTVGGTELNNYVIAAGTMSGASRPTKTLTDYVNGVASTPASATFAGSLTYTDQRIGGLNTGTSSLYWTGDIAEVLIYDSSLSKAQLDQVGSYLSTKYGIAYTPEPGSLAILALGSLGLLRRRHAK